MGYRDGSENYQTRSGEGWVEGSAKYADEEPHHGPGYVYVSMHSPRREALLTRIIEGPRPRRCSKAVEARAFVVERFQKISENAEADYDAAYSAGRVKSYLVRETGGGTEDIELPVSGERGFVILSESGWDNVEQEEDQWMALYYRATILRESP